VREEDRAKFEELIKSPEYKEIVPGMLYKRVVTEGDPTEKCPSWNATVTVHYVGKLLDGKQFDSSVDRNEPFEFHVGQGAVIKGWDQGVPTMCVGEKAYLLVHPDFGYGKSGSGSIPGGAVLEFLVTMIDYVEDDHEFPDSAQDRIQAAKTRQEAGKTLFNNGKYKRAIAKYDKGCQLVEILNNPTDE